MKLSVIIVNYNVKYFLEQCLYSVQAALKKMTSEIIVVDNASTDKSVEYLQPKFPSVRFISNTTNIGFGAACNQGFKIATGEFILFLNPDCIVPEDCLEKCISFLTAQSNGGAIGVRMLDGSGHFLKESKRAFPSLSASFFKLFGLAALFPKSKLFAKYYLGHLDENKNHETDVLAGAFMMIKRNVFEKVNGFDEDFFMYGEDIDLSYRIQKAGFKNYYYSETEIIHFKGESTKKGDLNYIRMFYNAMRIFVNKYYKGGLSKFFINAGIWLMSFVSAITNGMTVLFHFNSLEQAKDRVIVGTEVEYESVRSILNNAGLGQKVIERIALTEISSLNGKNLSKELILCAGTLSYKEVIELIKQYSSYHTIKIHKTGSMSIVGSSSKDSPGYAIGLE